MIDQHEIPGWVRSGCIDELALRLAIGCEMDMIHREARVPERDWAGRTGEELSPLTLPVMEA